MQGTKLLNTRIMMPRPMRDTTGESGGSGLLPVDTFIGTESTSDSAGQVTLSFDIEKFRRTADAGEMPTPLAILLCSADARALGKALLESADVAERLAEEVRSMK
jgi:hypothetical protein